MSYNNKMQDHFYDSLHLTPLNNVRPLSLSEAVQVEWI